MSEPLLNARELCQRLGISERTFYRFKRLGKFRRFESKFPIGVRKYSAELVERCLSGDPISQFGRRAS